MKMTTIMTLKKLRGAAFALTLFSAAACAQPADQTSSKAGNVATAPAGVTLVDFIKRHERKLLADDTDGDGKISRSEFLAAAKAGKADPAKRFAKIDRNRDGMLDRAEIDATLTRRFQRLDTNGDGVASGDERAAAHNGKERAGGHAKDS